MHIQIITYIQYTYIVISMYIVHVTVCDSACQCGAPMGRSGGRHRRLRRVLQTARASAYRCGPADRGDAVKVDALEPRKDHEATGKWGKWALLTRVEVKGQMIQMVAMFWESVQLGSTWKGSESTFAFL